MRQKSFSFRFLTADILFSLALMSAGGLLPVIHPEMAAMAVPLLLATGLLCYMTGRSWGAADLLLILPLLFSGMAPDHFRAFPPVLLFALLHWREAREAGDSEGGVPPGPLRARFWLLLSFLTTCYSLFMNMPQFYFITAALQEGLNRLLRIFASQPVDWGDGVSGIHVLAFFLLRACARVLNGRGARGLLPFAVGLPLGLLMLLVFLWTHGRPPRNIDLWVAMSVFLPMFAADGFFRPGLPRSPRGRAWRWLPLPLLAGLLLLPGTVGWRATSVEDLKIGIRDKGEWSWHLTRLGERPGPRIGGLLEVLRIWGADVLILDEEELLPPGDLDLLFVVHPDTLISPAMVDGFMEYMEGGGAIVLVGEHTNVHEIMHGCNSLLQGTGMRLKDDSALGTLHGWDWDYNQKYYLAPVNRGLRNAHQFGVSVGGSLDLSYPAYPLITGLMAFSDTGDPENEQGGLMGNKRYDWEERYGSIPLLAAQPIGKGILVVLGDTSGLMSLNTPFVWRNYLTLASSLAHRSPLLEHRLLLGLLLAALTAGGLLLLRGSGAAPGGEAVPLDPPIALGLLLTALCFLAGAKYAAAPPSIPQPDRVGWVDLSHQANWIQSGEVDWNAMALMEAVLDADLIPLGMSEFRPAELAGSRFLLIEGAARKYSSAECADLMEFVAGGGRLVIAGDCRRAAALERLLGTFGLGLDDVPLGTAPVARDSSGLPLDFEFYEAWPVQDLGSVPGEHPQVGQMDTLVSCWDYPVVVRKRFGAGVVIAVGDDKFFSKQSLEGDAEDQVLVNASRFRDRMRRPRRITPRPSPLKQEYLDEHGEELQSHTTPRKTPGPNLVQKRRRFAFSLLNIDPKEPPGGWKPRPSRGSGAGGRGQAPGGLRPGGPGGRMPPPGALQRPGGVPPGGGMPPPGALRPPGGNRPGADARQQRREAREAKQGGWGDEK